jgi:hypothetical protein
MTTSPIDRRSLRTQHFALCMGCALFLIVAWYLGPLGPAVPEVLGWAGIAALLLVGLAFLLFRKGVARIPLASGDGLAELRAALILHWALIESVCFFNAVIFLLNGAWMGLGAALFALLVLILRVPTDARIDAWLTGSA